MPLDFTDRIDVGNAVGALVGWHTSAHAEDMTYRRRLQYTNEVTGFYYVVYPGDDGQNTYGKISRDAYLGELDPDGEVHVQDVFGDLHTVLKSCLKHPNSETMFVCIHMAFLSIPAGEIME